jgi:hypothetical protein
MKTTVINIRDRNRFMGPPGEAVQFVFIGRPSKWGNPYKMPMKANDATREIIVGKFREYLKNQPRLLGVIQRELRGKVLVCFCKPKLCHGDILAAIAEGEEL